MYENLWCTYMCNLWLYIHTFLHIYIYTYSHMWMLPYMSTYLLDHSWTCINSLNMATTHSVYQHDRKRSSFNLILYNSIPSLSFTNIRVNTHSLSLSLPPSFTLSLFLSHLKIINTNALTNYKFLKELSFTFTNCICIYHNTKLFI